MANAKAAAKPASAGNSVGDFLKELHLTEGRNTGIHKMLRALDRNGSPKPLLETDEDRLYFLVTLYARKNLH